MIKDLNVIALPLDVAWGDRDENLYAAEQHIRRLPSATDVVILPELFSTGFVTDSSHLPALADTPSFAPTIDAMTRWASENNLAVCGSLLFSPAPGTYLNRAVFIEPSGETAVYDKRHLFSMGNESRIMTAGLQQPPVIRFRGWNIALAICYDLRFPVWLRNHGIQYDAMFVPANWPDVRHHAWSTLLAARAIENEAYVIGANRSGTDDFGTYSGLTEAYDFAGQRLGTSTEDDTPMSVTLERDAIDHFRRTHPYADDADDFHVHI